MVFTLKFIVETYFFFSTTEALPKDYSRSGGDRDDCQSDFSAQEFS